MLLHLICLAVTIGTFKGSNSLTRLIIDSLLHHPDNQACFDNVIHPFIRDQPHVFGSIMHRLLVTTPGERLITEQYELAFKLFKCFMSCGTDPFIQHHIQYINSECTNKDHWKFLRFWNDFHVYFWKHIESVTFLRHICTFSIKMNGHFDGLLISETLSVTIYGEDMDINWAMIPSFVKTLTVRYESEDFRTVNLSLIDPHCALKSLTITIRDGYIQLPTYPFPPTLNTLKLYRRSCDRNLTADITDYEVLQDVGRHIDNLTIHEKGGRFSWPTLNSVVLFRRINKLRHDDAPRVGRDDSKLIKWVGGSLTLLSIVVVVLCLIWIAGMDPGHD